MPSFKVHFRDSETIIVEADSVSFENDVLSFREKPDDRTLASSQMLVCAFNEWKSLERE